MKCTVCIDSETDECQVVSARVADFVRSVLFVLAKEKREQKPTSVNRPPTVLHRRWLAEECGMLPLFRKSTPGHLIFCLSMHSFPVLILSSPVCFLSPRSASLPQLFHKCLLPTFAFRIFRFPSASFRPLQPASDYSAFFLAAPGLFPLAYILGLGCLAFGCFLHPFRFGFPS